MAYGCVYQVTKVGPTTQYTVGEIVVLECKAECVTYTITDGPDAGTELEAMASECMEYPPE